LSFCRASKSEFSDPFVSRRYSVTGLPKFGEKPTLPGPLDRCKFPIDDEEFGVRASRLCFRLVALQPRPQTTCDIHPVPPAYPSSAISAFASSKSLVSKPSVNQP
jgi:hypothetical protein